MGGTGHWLHPYLPVNHSRDCSSTKGETVRKPIRAAALAALLLVSVPCFVHAAPAAKSGSGTIVLVFKDGHRQSFNLSEIDRVEFPPSGLASAEPSNPNWPPRGRFFGKWEVGDGSGGTFYITLQENGKAHRTIHEIDGHWYYANGEAQIIWNDGAKDAIRKVGNNFRKYAYSSGKSFTDQPDNEGDAHNTSPRPI